MASRLATPYPVPENEQNRLKALAEYHLLDSPPEEDFDRLAALAARLFNVPMVLVSLLANDRQYFKAKIGFDVCETSREVSFCAHAILTDEIFFIPDALKDPRFSSNPLVLGPPFIRFYAGKPLVASGGDKIGTVCIIDTKPRRRFDSADRKSLSDLAALVMERMEVRRLAYAKSLSQARFENIAATSPDAIICSNSEAEITFWNKSAERLFGYSTDDALNRTTEMIVPQSWRAIYEAELGRLRMGEGSAPGNQTIEVLALRKDGGEFPAEISLSTWREGNTTSIGAIVRDVSERRRNEERLLRLASVDTLTDLPNRTAWRECVDNALAQNKPVTVLLIDLDGFKEVNDVMGHSAGDAVLREVAKRLKVVCEKPMMIARLGGDEFVVLLPGNDERRAKIAAAKLVSAISDRYEFAGRSCDVGVSIGVALGPHDSSRADELLGAADLALYRAKATGRGRFEFFKPQLREAAIARRNFEIELRRAFENNEFELFYQPQVATDTGRMTGAEALLRWNHPERGLLTPASFLEVLSRKPSTAAVGEWILRTACRQAVEWRKIIPDFRIGINLFEAQFRSGRLVAIVKDIIEGYKLPPEAIELEIVENILLHNDPAILKLLRDLRALGIGLAFDDFGTGYASLSLLKRYPVSRLKIDRSFIRDVNTDPEDAAVVRAVLYLGKSFGMKVIAEGVENEAHLAFLKKNECPEAQGYLFGRPVSAKEFSEKYITAAAGVL